MNSCATKKVEEISAKGLIKDLKNWHNILYGAKFFFQEYLIYYFCWLKILWDLLLTHPKPIHVNLKVCLKKTISNYNLNISDSSFAPTLISFYPSPNVKLNGQYLINTSTVCIKIMNLYISYILDQWSGDLNTVFALNNCLFRSVRLTKTADPDRYKYSSHGIGFDSRSQLSYRDRSMGKKCNYFRSWYESICANW